MAQIFKHHTTLMFKSYLSNTILYPKIIVKSMVPNLSSQVPIFRRFDFQNQLKFYSNLLWQNGPEKRQFIISEDEIEPLFIRNSIENRITSQQYQANYKTEDRIMATQLNEINGFILSVFDGHGGPQLVLIYQLKAQYARKYLSDKVDNNIKKNLKKSQSLTECIEMSLIQSFDAIENQYVQIVRNEIKKGNKKIRNVGTCALCALVSNNYIYVANAGDSKAIIVSQTQDSVEFTKLNKKLNTSNQNQRQRLMKQFKNEEDILRPHPKNDQIYYLKGRLQPTRTLGDYYLKLPQFNFGPKIQNFNGPYLSHRPDIQKYELKKSSKYLILGSDGLWDQLNEFQVANIVLNPKNTNKGEAILKNVLIKIAKKYGLSQQQLQDLPEGARRAYHDDISIIVVDLSNQFVQQIE